MLAKLLLLSLLQAAEPPQAVKDFQDWLSGQPQGNLFEQRARYREHLKSKGLSDAQIGVLFRQIEADRWNRFFSNPPATFNSQPNAFMVVMIKGLQPGRALEIGMGQGRNSVYLAKQGWNVTGFDIGDVGMKIAREAAAQAGVKITTVNAAMEEFDYGTNQWDLIVATYEGASWREKAVRALKPGGIVIVEGFLRAPGTPPGASFGPNELLKFFTDLNLRILRYEDTNGKPDFGTAPGRVVRLCAQKPEAAQ
jgi:2-polyprenyl-3-methyl-5-hydroxy-6-metoxy-1,4-benzoquinol methylase